MFFKCEGSPALWARALAAQVQVAGDCDDSVDSLIKINKAENQFKIYTVSWNRNVTKIMHQKVVKD